MDVDNELERTEPANLSMSEYAIFCRHTTKQRRLHEWVA
jgi:hypothetical protein